MNKLLTVNFAPYRVGESFEFNRIAADEFAKCTNSIFIPFAERHKAAFVNFDESLKKQTFTVESEQLAEYDYYRDNAFTALEMLISRSLRCGVPARMEAAKRLDSILNRYGQLAQLPYMQESGLVKNLLQDLEKTEAAADIEIIGAAMWVNDLTTFNESFIVLFDTRNAEEAAIVTGATKENRVATEEAFKVCAQCLNTLILMDGFEPYAEIVNDLNNLINRQKTVIKARKTNNKDDK